jgi:hypothetical protein
MLVFTDDIYDDESLVSGLALPTVLDFNEFDKDDGDDTIDTKTTDGAEDQEKEEDESICDNNGKPSNSTSREQYGRCDILFSSNVTSSKLCWCASTRRSQIIGGNEWYICRNEIIIW